LTVFVQNNTVPCWTVGWTNRNVKCRSVGHRSLYFIMPWTGFWLNFWCLLLFPNKRSASVK